jgi:hypothetical protein
MKASWELLRLEPVPGDHAQGLEQPRLLTIEEGLELQARLVG